MVEELLNKVNQ